MPRGERLQLLSMAALFWLAVAWSAIKPYNPQDYFLEIAIPIAGFVLLAATLRRFRFSMLAYWLMLVEALLLIVGAHYTHEREPVFNWIRTQLGTTRNDFDRLAHFCVGLLIVIPVREVLRRTSPLRGGWLGTLSVACIGAFAALYEVFEWWIAIGFSPETGTAFLGSQGDVWDAQKDMLLDMVGATVGVLTFGRAHERTLAGPPLEKS